MSLCVLTYEIGRFLFFFVLRHTGNPPKTGLVQRLLASPANPIHGGVYKSDGWVNLA